MIILIDNKYDKKEFARTFSECAMLASGYNGLACNFRVAHKYTGPAVVRYIPGAKPSAKASTRQLKVAGYSHLTKSAHHKNVKII